MVCDRRILTPLVAWLCLLAPAAAHPILIHAGSLAWSDDAVRLSLTLEPHGLQHESLALGNSIARGRLIIELAKSIRILTEQGTTLTRSDLALSVDGFTVTCDYVISQEAATVVLLHEPGEVLGGISRQFRLAWERDNPDRSRVYRLTSGGNHVVVRRPGAIGRPDIHRAPFNEPVLRIMADRDAAQQKLLLDFPCTLLATWDGLIEIDGNTLTARAVAQSYGALAAWAQSHLSVRDGLLAASPVTITRIDLIDPAGEIISGTDTTPHSVYTTRVRWHLHTPGSDTGTGEAWAVCTWTGYNAAVLSLPVIIEGDTYPARLGVLTSAQATARIEQASPFRVRIGRSPCRADGEAPRGESRMASNE